MNNELIITPPEGFQIDKENSTFEKIVFKKSTTNVKSWHDLDLQSAWFINRSSEIEFMNSLSNTPQNYNLLPTEEIAKAMLALCQLTMLRHDARNGWVPDWENHENKYTYTIILNQTKWGEGSTLSFPELFSFQTEEIRDEFLKNHIDLLNQVKPLFS
jgi:hypothetical protein